MSNLDKAIRERLQAVRTNMTAHYAVQDDGRVDAVWNDAGELAMAVQQLLDWANDLETDFEGAKSIVGQAFANQIRQFLAASLGVSGEDRSKPTPAPRQPRVWQEGDPDPAEEGLVIRDADGDEAAYRNGHWNWTVIDGEKAFGLPWGWPAWDMAYPATEVLSEVVTPEGPA